MKFIYMFCIALVFITISCNKPAAEVVDTEKLRHVVLFKFKENVSKDSIAIVEKAFAQLPDKIEEINDFEWGINNSPENLDKGFTHAFLVTFSDEKGLETYLPHPEHQAFVKIVEPVLADVMVIDYWAKD